MALNGKVAIVTGGIGGIGRGIVKEMMNQGADVLAVFVEKPETVQSNIEELKAYAEEKKVRFAYYQMDQRFEDQVIATFDYAEKTLGKVDIFVGNAGTNIDRLPIWEYTEEQFDLVNAVNFKGTWLWVRECAKRLNDGGRVVLTASSSVEFPITGHSVYSPTKAAVEMLAIDASLELGEREITCNSVSPGLTLATGLNDLEFMNEDWLKPIAEASPRKRLGMPEDVAKAVVLLCQPEAYWISGQNIVASGGALS